MNYIESQILQHIGSKNNSEQIVVYKTGSHSGFLTYDGIDVNGKRICDEIQQETQSLTGEKDRVTKFSIVGYSLGGLISRYAIGYLYHQRYFDDIEAMNFVTFCTPHVGSLNPGKAWATQVFNFCVPYILSYTGTQLFLSDTKPVKPQHMEQDNAEKLPLLVWMADPRSVFYKALSHFKNRSLYANVINDKRTAWFTSAISIMDPFKSMINENASAYSLDFIDNYEPNVIDISKPISFKSDVIDKKLGKAPAKESGCSRATRSFFRKLNWLKVVASITLFTPLWAVWLLTKSVIERIKNVRRVALFFGDAANNLVHLYDPTPEHPDSETTNTEPQKPSFFRNIESDITNTFKDKTDTLVESVFNAMNSDSYKEYHNSAKVDIKKANPQSESSSELDLINLQGKVQNFNLGLIQNQLTIIQNLNALGWNKFPVLIRNTKQTHRAAIVRMPDPSFDEGKVIVKHFVNETFML